MVIAAILKDRVRICYETKSGHTRYAEFPFVVADEGKVSFTMSTECLNDMVALLNNGG